MSEPVPGSSSGAPEIQSAKPAPPSTPSPARNVAEPWPVSPAERPADPQVYRPLSVLAIIGFGIVGLYGLVLVLCAAAAVLKGSTLLWPLSTLVIPLTGVAVCAAAWISIQRSEGTKAGGTLAVWGMMLGFGFALTYSAYYGAKYLVIRDQAMKYGEDWLREVTKGRLDIAFNRTRLPEQRLDESDPRKLHETLESSVNQQIAQDPRMRDNRQGGPLDQFHHNPLCQLLLQGGEETQIQPLGVNSWDYSKGGYEVLLSYRISTPEASAEIYLDTLGSEGRTGDRAWNVVMSQSKIRDGTMNPTKVGQAMGSLRTVAYGFQQKWRERISQGRLVEAYLDWRPPDERRALLANFSGQVILTNVATAFSSGASVLLDDPSLYLPQFRDFVHGEFVHLDDNFWAPAADQKEMILKDSRILTLYPDSLQLSKITADPNTTEPWRRQGDKILVQQPISLSLPTSGFLVLGTIVLETDGRQLDKLLAEHEVIGLPEGARLPWRIVEIKLHNAKRQAAASPGGAPRAGA
jgi:hypothetical protein